MRKIERITQFKRDYKRESKGKHRNTLEQDFLTVLKSLVVDKVLEPKYRDHALTGNWSDYRDCHIKPDLVLIYRKPDDEIIQLVRLGSHNELGI
jgi:mRNA interferase YafQ